MTTHDDVRARQHRGIALTCFAAHTLKYRQDILNGDFTSWLPKPES